MLKLHLDFETKSTVDIRKVGAWAYAQHPSTEPLCLAFAINDGPVEVLTAAECKGGPGSSVKASLLYAALYKGLVGAHNVQFEYAVWLYKMVGYGWPDLSDPARWDCTMSRALMCGFPGSLEDVGAALKLPIQKDMEGAAVMHKLCKPYETDIITGEPRFRTLEEFPELHARLYKYCATDVETERLVDKALPDISPAERKVWELDLLINKRGVQVDRELASRAADIAGRLTTELNAQLKVLTGGKIDAATRVQAIKYYLADTDGLFPEKMDKTAVVDLLADPTVCENAKAVIAIRSQVGKSSTSKFAKAVQAACADGRVRGSLFWHGAHTGRWSARLLQLHNIPQGFATAAEQAPVVDLVMLGDADLFGLTYGNKSMDTLSKLLRAVVIAAPGKKLLSADYNAIEARGVFWLADQLDALDCYRRGDSPYVDMANYIYGRTDCSKKGTPKEYDLGKRAVLGCGFGMGWEKFRDTAKVQANIVVDDETAKRAVNGYREKYSNVRQMWYAVERAAINAVKNPGQVFTSCGERVAWGMSADRRFLVCRLPSGRFLRYYKPRVRVVPDKFNPERTREELCYWGEHPKTHQWIELKTYGGALTENVVQAVARDIMAHGMLGVEAAGFPLILTVHDELLAEVEEPACDCGSCHYCETHDDDLEVFIREMTTLPAWAKGYPVAAEGWIGDRYRK